MILKLINPKYYFTKLRDILRFISNPIPLLADNKTTIHKLNDLLVILAITLAISVTSFLLIANYIKPVPTTKLFELQQKLGSTYFFLFSVFLIPLIEESLYRLPLKFSPLFLSISFVVISYRFISKYFFNSLMYDLSSSPITRISLAIVAALIFYIIIRQNKTRMLLEKFWSKHFRWVFYISSVAFAFIHINNYEPTYFVLLMTPVITLPQLILGLTTSYMRINYGFVYSLLLHILYNSSQYWLPL